MTYFTVLNFFHFLALTIWVGGMIYTKLILFPALQVLEPAQKNLFFGTVSPRFSRLSWSAIGILVLSGLLKFPHYSPFEDMTYGITLSVKLVLVILMIVNGLWATYNLNPKLQSLAPYPGDSPSSEFLKTQKKLSTIFTINMVLGIVVLFLASML